MPSNRARRCFPLILGAWLISSSQYPADAGEAPPIAIRFENHHFVPQSLTVVAGQELVIMVVNASTETIEFESFKLNREKAVSPGETISVHIPALSPGSYDFYDDFHQDVPEGMIVAK